MSYWEKTNINLGTIIAGPSKKITFKALENIPKIKSIIPYCGCTATKYNEQTRELVINYNNTPIPHQVKGAQAIQKRVDIIYEDDSTETLTIYATRLR